MYLNVYNLILFHLNNLKSWKSTLLHSVSLFDRWQCINEGERTRRGMWYSTKDLEARMEPGSLLLHSNHTAESLPCVPVVSRSLFWRHWGTNTVISRWPRLQNVSTASAIPRQEKNRWRPWLERRRKRETTQWGGGGTHQEYVWQPLSTVTDKQRLQECRAPQWNLQYA